MSGGRAVVWAEAEVVAKVEQKSYSGDDIKFLWSGLYDRLMNLDAKVKESPGWKGLKAILFNAYELCQEGRWQESVERYGAQIKGLMVHLSLLVEAFGPETELQGEALATLARYETSRPPEPDQVDLFQGVFA